MVKISLGGYDDGEGPSNRIQKRLRMEPEDGQASRNEKEEHAGDGGEARSAEHDENPVGSCENGHIACSNCCARLGNKCPMCSMPIGYNRCRAIEKFTYDKFFTVFLNLDHKTIVLQEKNDANLFVIHNNHELLGNLIHITCIGPKSKTGFHYDILARSQGTSLILQSYTKIVQGHFADAPSAGMLLIPSDFFGSGQIKLDIRIRS
ncbi:hypothetical protein AHAS_Ahas03G0364000 [Arachis hypogaea]